MSDIATEVQAPAAPAAPAEQPQAPPQQAPDGGQPAAPMTARQAMEAARSGTLPKFASAPASKEAPASPATEVNAAGRVVEPATKQYVAGQPQQEGAPVPGGDVAKPGVPEGFVSIPVPEGHQLRARGIETLTFPKDQEEYGRWSLNQGLRVQQYEDIQGRLKESQRKAVQEEARARFWQEHAGQFFNEDFYDKYERIKAEWGEAEADRFKKGVMAEAQEKLQSVAQESENEFARQELREEGTRFRNWAVNDARDKFPAFFTPSGEPRPEMARAFQMYASQIEASGQPILDQRAWYEMAMAVYQTLPDVRAAINAARQRAMTNATTKAVAEANEAARKAEEERLATAAANRRRNPMGAVAPVDSQVRQAPLDDGRPRNARELMSSIRGRR